MWYFNIYDPLGIIVITLCKFTFESSDPVIEVLFSRRGTGSRMLSHFSEVLHHEEELDSEARQSWLQRLHYAILPVFGKTLMWLHSFPFSKQGKWPHLHSSIYWASACQTLLWVDSQRPGLTLCAPEFSSRPGSSSSHLFSLLLTFLFSSLPFSSFSLLFLFSHTHTPVTSFCEGLSCSLDWLQSHAPPAPASWVPVLDMVYHLRLDSRWKSHRNPKVQLINCQSKNTSFRKKFREKRVGQRVSRIMFGKSEESEGGKLDRRVS